MGFFQELFSNAEDNEKKIAELWGKLKKMPKQQLLDIVKFRPNTTHGKLALILLFKNARSEATKMVASSEGNLEALLGNMMRSDVILLGTGNQFDEIREYLKEALRVVQPSGNW